MADDLARWLHGDAILARPAGRVEKLWRWCRRHPLRAVNAALAVGILAALVALATAVGFLREQDEAAKLLTRANDAGSSTVLSSSIDGTARLWRLPEPLTGEVDEVIPRVESLAGYTISSSGVVRVLDASAWRARQKDATTPSGRRRPPGTGR